MMNTVGLIASIAILIAYALSIRWDRPILFHWANTLGWVPVALPAIAAEIWGAALLSVCFGLIGSYAVIMEKT
jgi:hypothetical protein